MKKVNMSMGTGNIIVEFFSAEIVFRVFFFEQNVVKLIRDENWFKMLHQTCRYLSWRAAGESPIISDASRNARDAFCSPSDAIIFARASLEASAFKMIEND